MTRAASGMARVVMLAPFLLLVLAPPALCARQLKVFGGKTDDCVTGSCHPYSGLLYNSILGNPNCTCPTTGGPYYGCWPQGGYYAGSCTGSLVNIPGLPANRIFLTAGHCVITDNKTAASNFFITFSYNWSTVSAAPKPCPFSRVGFTVPGYIGIKSWTPYTWSSDIMGAGKAKQDHALVLLDRPVTGITPAVIAPINKYVSKTGAGIQTSLPTIGMAGFGIAGFGKNGSTQLGKPDAFIGPRNRMYVVMETNSASSWLITSQMVAAVGDETACNGDSGAAGIVPGTGAPYQILGTTSAGDYQCRATNTFARVDTTDFAAWVETVKPQILAAAAAGR